MVNFRPFNKGKRFGRRKRAFRRKPNMYKFVKKVIEKNGDHNFTDSAINAAPDWLGVVTTDLTAVSVGTAYNSRYGNEITLTSIKGYLQFVYQDAQQLIRAVIFQWHCNSATTLPLATNIFVGGQLGDVRAPMAMYNKEECGTTSTILWDSGPIILNSVNETHKIRKFLITPKMMNRFKGVNKSSFTLGAATGSDHIFLMLVSDSAAIGHPTVNGFIRTSYLP